MGRNKTSGGGKAKSPVSMRPTKEQETRLRDLLDAKIAADPRLGKIPQTDWLSELIGFEQSGLFTAGDRLTLRGISLTEKQRHVIDNLGDIIEKWLRLGDKEQELLAGRVANLLDDILRRTGGNDSSQHNRTHKGEPNKTGSRRNELKTRSA